MPTSSPLQEDIIPTLVIGLGGTGLEVLMQVRQRVQESYGSLSGLPIGFLAIDTQPDEGGDDPLEAAEKYWARVTFEDAHKIVRFPEKYPWVHQWLPTELNNKPELLTSEEGTGQIRACGRLAFFLNQAIIFEKCKAIRTRMRRYESLPDNDLTAPPRLNIFVIASLFGGTGSGMLLDLGYSLRRWFGGENVLETVAMMISPDAFSGTQIGLRMRENSYAALMEYNYFADASTRYRMRYSDAPNSRIEDSLPPYDFAYLVGNSSQGASLKLPMIQEMVAQQIALDLIPDYAAHKRSVRHRIHQQIKAADAPPQGRSYPRNFYSFGIASLEVPIHTIRRCIGFRLAADLCKWWLHEGAIVPELPEVQQELQDSGLLGKSLRANILMSAEMQPYQQVVQLWCQALTAQVQEDGWLECTAQLPQIPPFAQENGKILNFIAQFFTPQIEQFRYEYFRDTTPDPDAHGSYVRQMYANRDRLIESAVATLQYQLSTTLSDRHQGAKYMQTKLRLIERIFNLEIEKLEYENRQIWYVVEREGIKEYKIACSRMIQYRTQWAASKQEWMAEQFQVAIAGQTKALQAFLERKSRAIAVEILRRLLQTVNQNKWRLDRWTTRVSGLGAGLWGRSLQAANQIDTAESTSVKLFHREELDELYTDLVALNQGMDIFCQSLTEEVLYHCTRRMGYSDPEAKAWFQLLDVEKISEANSLEFERIVTEVTQQAVKHAPPKSKIDLKRDICRRLIKQYPQERDQRTQIEQLFTRSQPLIALDQQAPLGRFHYIEQAQAGLAGGAALQEAAVQAQFTQLQKYFRGEGAIAPLPDTERHKLIAVQEIGGFSLRCVTSVESWRKFYQAWRGQRILAERIAFKGGKASFPIPVHIQDDIVFWDIIPNDPLIERLVVIARAVGILKEEHNSKTNRPVIQYYKPGTTYQEAVALATTWEDTVQVLELPDCRSDRLEIQRQLTDQLRQAKTDPQRQELRRRLENYLKRGNGNGKEDARYMRQKAIVEKFMVTNQLG
jgi:hypothetical protein